MLRAAVLGVLLLGLVAGWAPGALAAPPGLSIGAPQDRLAGTPSAPPTGGEVLTRAQALSRFLVYPKVKRWLDRYPPRPTTDATYDASTRRWRVHVWSGRAGEIATGRVEDPSGRVLEAWTGPQVAWRMARGSPGAFGGKILNTWWVWGSLSAIFLVGLIDRRRLFSLHTLDLLTLLSFGVSLWFFNRGEVFRSVPLAAPPLLYLVARTSWIGFRERRREPRATWPVWVLAAAAVFLMGFRVGLNLDAPRSVIDVGYAGVIGADRLFDGQVPYGHMPDTHGAACGPANADGEIGDHIQKNGRCESGNARGDTYGPVAYLAYVPAVLTLGWRGKWDSLPAAHATAILFDLLTVLGLLLVGRRFGGARLAATLAFGWLAFPFTTYVLATNANDSIMPALLVWGFWLCTSPWARGVSVALAGWTKFAALLLAPLWLTYPDGLRRGPALRFTAALGAATVAAFSILLLEPSLGDAIRTFSERTLGYQVDRASPFSVWGWGQYHARGIPDLRVAQRVLQVCVLVLAGVAAALPRRKGPLELAALTAAILIGFELGLTHWFYLYIPWFLPFVLVALFLPRAADPVPAAEPAAGNRSVATLALVAVVATAGIGLLLASGWIGGPGISDVPVYQYYGERIVAGDVPYRDFVVEYPPVAFVTFAVPALLSADREGYDAAFAALMILCLAGIGALLVLTLHALEASRLRIVGAVTTVCAGTLLLGPFVLTRFDFLPAAVTAAAVAAVVAGRGRLGAVLLGVAIATKLYPAVLLPLVLVRVLRRDGRREAVRQLGIALGVVAIAYLPFFVVAPEGVARSVWRQVGRPLQIESLGSGVLLALHHTLAMPLAWASGSGSQNLTGTVASVAAAATTVAGAAALILVWVVFARGEMGDERFVRFVAAAGVAFVAFGKVLSPQFLVWLLPLVALVAGMRGAVASALLLIGCALTRLWFPGSYWVLVKQFDGLSSGLVLVRDIVLVGVFIVLIQPGLRARERAPARSTPPALSPGHS